MSTGPVEEEDKARPRSFSTLHLLKKTVEVKELMHLVSGLWLERECMKQKMRRKENVKEEQEEDIQEWSTKFEALSETWGPCHSG